MSDAKPLGSLEQAVSRLEALKLSRSERSGALLALQSDSDRLAACIAEEDAARRDLNDLGASEIAAVKAWADDPQGEAPKADARRRANLTKNLVDAQRKADEARGAHADVQTKIGDAKRLGTTINADVSGAAVDVLIETFRRDLAGLQSWAVSLRLAQADVFAVPQFLRSHVTHLQATGRGADATEILRKVQDLLDLKSLQTAPFLDEVNAGERNVAARFQGLLQ